MIETTHAIVSFSNPRLTATFEDWPLSFSKRGTATFQVHTSSKGSRVSRTTTGKPKFTTYGARMCIVDGSNGKTYLLQLSTQGCVAIRIISSDLQHDASQEETGRRSAYIYHDGEDAPFFQHLLSLIEQANAEDSR